jgi:hypothetical protein
MNALEESMHLPVSDTSFHFTHRERQTPRRSHSRKPGQCTIAFEECEQSRRPPEWRRFPVSHSGAVVMPFALSQSPFLAPAEQSGPPRLFLRQSSPFREPYTKVLCCERACECPQRQAISNSSEASVSYFVVAVRIRNLKMRREPADDYTPSSELQSVLTVLIDSRNGI